MIRFMKRHPLFVLFSSLAAGVCLAVGTLVGTLATVALQPQQPQVELPLFAAASDTGVSMSMATGPIDEEMEGCFFLDFLTGDLQCAVMNGRTAALGGAFKGNVIKDLGIEKSKKPSYLMATGTASFVGVTGATRPARCVVYVLDQNSGNFAGYSLNWNRTDAAAGRLQQGLLITLLKGNARTAGIRE